MPKVRLNYDGWLALPADVRKRLGLSTGYQLELELVGGAIVLRPAGSPGVAAPVSADRVSAQPVIAPPEPSPIAAPTPTAKRGPGRPRKIPAATALPPTLKTRGRRATVPAKA